MKKFIWFLILAFSLLGCGPHGDKKNHNPRPSLNHAVLVDYKPLKGTHFPLVQYFQFNEHKQLLKIYFLSEFIDTSSWVAFKGSSIGKHLVGAMFKNGDSNIDFYLWFVVQMGPEKSATYTLELHNLGPNIVGYESLKMGDKDETKIQVTYSLDSPK